MSTTTLPHPAGTHRASRPVSPSDVVDPHTDEGLRQAVRAVGQSGSWDQPVGSRLLGEIRRRAVRNAAHVTASTGVPMSRGLVDDVLLAAWTVLHRHCDKVLAAQRPWAYLMSSAQKQVLDEVRAQQLLTDTASIRGRAREVLPGIVRPVGTTASEMTAAFRHESRGEDTGGTERQVVPQVGRHDQAPLLTHPPLAANRSASQSTAATVTVLSAPCSASRSTNATNHGSRPADSSSPVAAVDWLADLFAASYVGWWEWAARRDPILAHLGLSPDQCGALVALLAGSRRYRHNGKRDSLLAAVRTGTETGRPVELSPLQRRRIAVYTGQPAGAPSADLPAARASQRDGRALATTGV